MNPDASPPPTRPPSDVSQGQGGVGVLVVLAWVAVCHWWPGRPMAGPFAALVMLGLAGLAMAAWALVVDKAHRHAATGLDWAAPRGWRAAWPTAWVKLAGLWACWLAIALFYSVVRWYWLGEQAFAMQLLQVAAPVLWLASLPYVWWVERYVRVPADEAWHCGAWVLGRGGAEPKAALAYARSWGVKGFFIAFMLGVLPGNFAGVVGLTRADVADPLGMVRGLIALMFLLDVALGTLGYVLALRPLGTQIRSANPYLDGWLAALVCYPPFTLMGPGGVLDYGPGGADWSAWAAGRPVLLWGWGGWLVLLTGLYAWATVAFGLRFSNLTWRGTVTHGPYALCRHPAYLAKNLFWWSASLPFLPASGSLADGLRNTCLLAGVSAVYWWRAKTEERHLLGEDAKYRAYWAWAGAHAPVTRAIARLTGF